MSVKLSKNKEKFKVNGREYQLTKWSTISTVLEGKKLLMAVAPSLTAIADMKMGNKGENLDEIIEGTDIEFLLTGAITQLSNSFTDEHFEDLVTNLLGSLRVKLVGEDGELADEYAEIEDYSEHFDEYSEDFEEVVIKSAKANIYDFFMKQATVRSSIEKMLPVVAGLKNKLNKGMNNGTTED